MAISFDRLTASGRKVSDIIFKPLETALVTPTVVDVGARNGIEMPLGYASRARFIGFEPNPAEYEKLRTRSTDAMRLGLPMAHFKSEEYINCALWNAEDMRPFYITAGTGACTLMGEANGPITQRMWLDYDIGRDKPYSELHTQIQKTIPMKCNRLDRVLSGDTKIDFLKLDVEGAELSVLEGSEGLLQDQNILFIKTEFCFTPYYQTHPLLGHLHVLLDKFGFRLLDLDLHHARYTRDKTNIPAEADRRLIYAGDAYFAVDPDRRQLSRMDQQRLAVISLAFGFNSFGVSLLRDAQFLSNEEVAEVEAAVCHVPWKQRVRNTWGQIPNQAVKVLKKVLRRP